MVDATARPMRVPITFVPYLEKHRIYELFQELMSRIIIKRPEDHLSFLKSEILEIIKPKTSISVDVSVKDDSTEIKLESISGGRLSGSESISEKLTASIDQLMETSDTPRYTKTDELLLSMSSEEFEKFSEKVISDWKAIKRAKKWFSIRELSKSLEQEDSEPPSIEKRTSQESEEASNSNDSLTLIFQAKDNGISSLHDVHGEQRIEESKYTGDSKSIASVRSLDIKIQSGHTDEALNTIGDGEIIAKLSYAKSENDSVEGETETTEYISKTKILEGVPSENLEELKMHIADLIRNIVETLTLGIQNLTIPIISNKKEKTIKFPRGPVMIPRVVLLGPPASGKSLQAAMLAKKLKLVHVDMKKLLLEWEASTGKGDSRNFFRRMSTKGDELMNELNASLLRKRLLMEDCIKNGWVLTHYPSTVDQARALDKMEIPPNRIIYLDRPLELCRKYLKTRVFDVDTGEECFLEPKSARGLLKCSVTEHITELQNKGVFGQDANDIDTVSGYIVELGSSTDDDEELFESTMALAHLKKRVLISPEDDPKNINLQFDNHQAVKDGILSYYGGWCTILEVQSLPPKRVHEAILSVIKGPFPSFNEAGIDDRNSALIETTLSQFEVAIKAKLKAEFLKFFTKTWQPIPQI